MSLDDQIICRYMNKLNYDILDMNTLNDGRVKSQTFGSYEELKNHTTYN